MRLPRNTQAQLVSTSDAVASPLIHGSGSSAKLPVISSRPSSTIMTRPTGKISAPTSGWPVVKAALKARLVATPRMAPDSMPLIRRSGIDKSELPTAGFRHGLRNVCRFHVIHR